MDEWLWFISDFPETFLAGLASVVFGELAMWLYRILRSPKSRERLEKASAAGARFAEERVFPLLDSHARQVNGIFVLTIASMVTVLIVNTTDTSTAPPQIASIFGVAASSMVLVFFGVGPERGNT